MAGILLADLVRYLDDYLAIRATPDEPNAVNGLQVENRSGRVTRIVAAVDASLETIRAAAGQGHAGDHALLLVHHGLFWDGNVPLTDRRFRRVQALFEHDMALYSAHIPLDLHAEVGNNAVLARDLGLQVAGRFGGYRGVELGVWGTLDITRTELAERLDGFLRTSTHVIPGGPERCQRIGIITGGAGGSIALARAAGLDTYITGEGAHYTHFDAVEWGLNVLYAGHYATEQVGVQALARHLHERFDLPWEFHWHPTGL